MTAIVLGVASLVALALACAFLPGRQGRPPAALEAELAEDLEDLAAELGALVASRTGSPARGAAVTAGLVGLFSPERAVAEDAFVGGASAILLDQLGDDPEARELVEIALPTLRLAYTLLRIERARATEARAPARTNLEASPAPSSG